MTLMMPLYASASDAPAVSVTVLGSRDVKSQVFTAKVRVCFNDMSLYNDNMFLSYHIYDTSDFHESSLDGVFENERYPIVLDENNCAEFEIPIDCSQLGYTDAYIQFDIVDTVNLYWLYLTGNGSFELDMIHSHNDPIGAVLGRYADAIVSRPFIFAINIIVLVSCIAALVVVRKKRLFTFKRTNCQK